MTSHASSYSYSAIIPALNEAQTIARAIRETRNVFEDMRESFEIIVVDDGSVDDTLFIVTQLAKDDGRIRVLHHAANRGKGAAVRTGVAHAAGDTILFFDADLATHPREIVQCVPLLRDHDLVIGSRAERGTRITTPQPWYRVLFGTLFNLVAVRWYLRLPYKDTQCGFKVFRRSLAPLIAALRTDGWAFDAELLYRAHHAQLRTKTLPVTWTHGTQTRVRIRDAWRIWNEIRRIPTSISNRDARTNSSYR